MMDSGVVARQPRRKSIKGRGLWLGGGCPSLGPLTWFTRRTYDLFWEATTPESIMSHGLIAEEVQGVQGVATFVGSDP
jgi:hypothetical protein